MKRIGSEWVDELATLDDQESGWRPDPRVDLGFFSTTSFMVDTTVSFICLSISSGLKSALEAG